MDMALHSQLLRNLAHGRFMQTSFLPYSFAGNHFWPGLYLLVPFYQWLGIHGLLALQCVVVASGAFAAYRLSRDITDSEEWGRALALAYLLQPTLSAGVLFDYHMELFSVPFALFALLGLRLNRLWLWPCLLLSLCFYEIVAVVFFFLGMGLLLSRGRRRTGAIMAVICLTYIGIVFFVVMPHFRGNVSIPHWSRYSHLGNGPWEAMATLLSHPFRSLADSTKLREILGLRYLFIAFGFLPFLSLKHLLPAIPLLFVLLLSRYGVQLDVRYGYVAPALPFLVLSAAHGAARLIGAGWFRRRHIAELAPRILMVCSVLLFAYFQIKRPLRRHPFQIRPNMVELRNAGDLVPREASLSADNHIGAHFTDRDILLVAPTVNHGSLAVEFVLADLKETEFKNSQYWISMGKLIESGEYGPLYLSNDVLLLQRGITNEIPGRAALDRITVQMRAAQEKENRRKP
jgi:uncharacterized membrane protein